MTADSKSYIVQLGKTAPAGEQYVSWNDPALVFTVPGYGLTAVTRDLVTMPPPARTVTNQPPVTTAPPTNAPVPTPKP